MEANVGMRAWVTRDAGGCEYLIRTGTGVVTAVVPVGDADGPVIVYRVEIACDRPVGRSRAVRFSAHGLVDADDPMVILAMDACASALPVRWEIEWHRHAWVPGHLPIGSLDLASDARAALCLLVPVAVDAPVVEQVTGGPADGEA